jgi:hypothetical protein
LESLDLQGRKVARYDQKGSDHRKPLWLPLKPAASIGFAIQCKIPCCGKVLRAFFTKQYARVYCGLEKNKGMVKERRIGQSADSLGLKTKGFRD